MAVKKNKWDPLLFALFNALFVLMFAFASRIITNNSYVHVICQACAGIFATAIYRHRQFVKKNIRINILLFWLVAFLSVSTIVVITYLIFRKNNPLQLVEIIDSDVGIIPPNGETFSIIGHYSPSGFTGDVGDLQVRSFSDSVEITYIPAGKGPHEWDFKCIDGKISNEMAKFAGVIFLHPPNNYGDIKGGYYLPNFSSITFEAKAIANRTINVDFVCGGITWRWAGCEKVPVKYPGTLMWRRFGVDSLNDQWRPIKYSLEEIPPKEFRRVLGPLSCIISASNNGITLPLEGNKPDTIKIWLRHILYHKK